MDVGTIAHNLLGREMRLRLAQQVEHGRIAHKVRHRDVNLSQLPPVGPTKVT